MLGVVVGVSCVLTVIAIRNGAAKKVADTINSLGTNDMVVLPGSTERSGLRMAVEPSFTIEDVAAIRNECPSVIYATPSKGVGVQMIGGGLNWGTMIRGVDTDWPHVYHRSVVEGEFFNDSDVRIGTKVCVLGATVADSLFPAGSAVGQSIRIRNVPFKIVGVLERRGSDASGNDQDDFALAPFRTVATHLAGDLHPNVIVVSAISGDRIQDASDEIDALLRQRHRILAGHDPDFSIRSWVEINAASSEQTKTLSTLLLSIAAISLLVGGIGIMNIMLVSVTERTREIGVRMAIGAKGRHVLLQFLFEAVTLAVVGGLIGVIIGVGASMAVGRILKWPIVVTPISIALSFGVAAAVGVFFGFYPARKASHLDPIDALRYE